MNETIREAIISVINSESDLIHSAYPTMQSTFAGFPACVVSPSEVSSDYGSTVRDRREYVFTLRIYYPVAKESEQATVENRLDKVVDELFDIFKERKVLGVACDWVAPNNGEWGSTTASETVYRWASITLRCVKMVANV